MPKGKAIPYSAEELAWIKARRAWPRDALLAIFCGEFNRDDVTLGALNGLCKRKGWFTGRDGKIVAGSIPHNKGKPHPARGRSAETQFRKGERRGVKPIGTERLAKDGYRERKIHNGMPPQSRWRAIHLIEWEAINGPVPEGWCLKCLGDKLDTNPVNWEAVPRALLPRLNGGRFKTKLAYAEAAPELRPTILAIAKLEHRAREVRAA